MTKLLLVLASVAACHHDPAPAAPASHPAEATAAPAAPEDPEIAKLRGFKEQACACKDKPCVDAVQQDLIAWSMHTHGPANPEADAKTGDALMSAFEKCVVAAGGKL